MKKTLLALLIPGIIGCSANQNYKRNIEEFPDSIITPASNNEGLDPVLFQMGKIKYLNVYFDGDGRLDPVFMGDNGFGYVAPSLSIRKGSPGTPDDDESVWYLIKEDELKK